MSETPERTRLCRHRECNEPATAIYEGIREPAEAFRYAACDDHAPDAPAVELLE